MPKIVLLVSVVVLPTVSPVPQWVAAVVSEERVEEVTVPVSTTILAHVARTSDGPPPPAGGGLLDLHRKGAISPGLRPDDPQKNCHCCSTTGPKDWCVMEQKHQTNQAVATPTATTAVPT